MNHLSLFTGIGGFELGQRLAGMEEGCPCVNGSPPPMR